MYVSQDNIPRLFILCALREVVHEQILIFVYNLQNKKV